MQVAIPHNLSREEVRRRFRDNAHRIGDNIPGGMAEVTTSWPSEDRMDLAIAAMGQVLSGFIEIGDSEVLFHMNLPPMLGFLEPVIEGAIRQQGQDLLEGPASRPGD